jgi:hypothetical protein
MWNERAGRGPRSGNAQDRRHAAERAFAHDVGCYGGLPRPFRTWPFPCRTISTSRSTRAWESEAEDAAHQAWVTDHMRGLERFSSGIQLADENLAARPFRFLAEGNFRRLEAVRSKYDPSGLFHSYMGIPSR